MAKRDRASEVFRVRWTWDQAEGVTFEHDVDCCRECARGFAGVVAAQAGRMLVGDVTKVVRR